MGHTQVRSRARRRPGRAQGRAREPGRPLPHDARWLGRDAFLVLAGRIRASTSPQPAQGVMRPGPMAEQTPLHFSGGGFARRSGRSRRPDMEQAAKARTRAAGKGSARMSAPVSGESATPSGTEPTTGVEIGRPQATDVQLRDVLAHAAGREWGNGLFSSGGPQLCGQNRGPIVPRLWVRFPPA
jgi:hypothetical protein